MLKRFLLLFFLLLINLATQIPAYFIASIFVDTKIIYLFCFVSGAAWCYTGLIFNTLIYNNGILDKAKKEKEEHE